METKQPDEKDETWSGLFHEFTDNTSLHGLRYIFMRYTWMLRRFIWLLILTTAIVVVVYINVLNVELYLSNPKKINMDVSVKKNLTFPAVTLCNYNFHKFTSVAALGIFDSFYTYYDNKAVESVNGDWYKYRQDVCVYDADLLEKIVNCKTDLTVKPCETFRAKLQGVSSLVCESSCSQYMTCPGFWYNRTSLSCILLESGLVENISLIIQNNMSNAGNSSADTEGSKPAIEVIKSGICAKESAEYYERIQVLEIPSFMCTFDDKDCPKLDTDSFSATNVEHLEVTRAINPPADYSTGTEKGRYLYLPEISSRAGFYSFISTKDFYMSDSCLEFYYYFVGQGNVSVYLEQIGESELVLPDGNGKWGRFSKRLPDGKGRVHLRIRRPYDKVLTGMAIDNFAIQPCYKYELNCLHDPQGITYQGNVSVTQNGVPCTDRKKSIPPVCRNPDEDVRPWCITQDSWDYCDIPHCGCLETEFWCSKSKRCIPKSFTCDGQDDCGDRQDEIEPCTSSISFKCNFEDAFKCGYQSIGLVEGLQWEQRNGHSISDTDAPSGDYNRKKNPYFMYVETDLAKEGDKAILRSPTITLPNEKHDMCVRFLLQTHNSAPAIYTKLDVVLVPENQLKFPNTTMNTVDLRETSAGWNIYRAKLPHYDAPGEHFYVEWIYTMGFPSASNLALDLVSISQCYATDNYTVSLAPLQPSDSLTCQDFSDTAACPVSNFVDSVHIKCSTTAKSIEELESSWNTMSITEGIFESPSYPDDDWGIDKLQAVAAVIEAPAYSIIKLHFNGYTVSKYTEDCGTNGHILMTLTDVKHSLIEERRYCISSGNQNNDLTFETKHLTISVVSNYSFNPVFRGSYQIIPLQFAKETKAGHSLACFRTGPGSSGLLNTENHIYITTSLFKFESPQCFSFYFLSSYSEVKVTLVGTRHAKLFEATGKQELNMSLPVGTYFIRFSISVPPYVNNTNVFALEYMKTEPGLCFEKAQGGSVTCDFTDADQCGYIDVSPGERHWTKLQKPGSPENTKNTGMMFRLESKVKPAVKGFLLSPRFQTKSDSCIKISAMSPNSAVLRVFILESSEVLRQESVVRVADIILRATLRTIEIGVSANSHYIMFGVEVEEDKLIFIDHVVQHSNVCENPSATLEDIQLNTGYAEYLSSLGKSEAGAEVTNATMTKIVNATKIIGNELPVPPVEIEKKHHRRDYSVYFGVDEVFEKTAHRLEDMIFDCSYYGQPCDLEKDFLRQRTEYGICYTFNPGKNISLKTTSAPGSTYGLQLVVNTEAYETTKGFTTDKGVKVHIHDQDEIPYVHHVGLAAGMSQHTYFAITLNEFNSLGAPYGNCDTRHLELFPNEHYTRFRCNQQCLTRQWEKVCNCRMHHMYGESPYCTFQEYLHCKTEIEAGLQSCDCPTACHIVYYSTQSSMASLSRLGVSELLLNSEKINKIQEAYNTYLNYDYRMLPEYYQKIDKTIDQTRSLFWKLWTFVNQQSADKPNARDTVLRKAVKRVYSIAKNDITSVTESLGDIMKAERCYHAKATESIRESKSAIRNIEFFRYQLSSSNLDEITLQTLVNSVVGSLSIIQILSEKHCAEPRSRYLKSPLVPEEYKDYCDKYYQQYNGLVAQLAEKLISLKSLTTASKDTLIDPNTNQTFKELQRSLKRYSEGMEKCDFHLNAVLITVSSLPEHFKLYSPKVINTAVNMEEEVIEEIGEYHWHSGFLAALASQFKHNNITVIEFANRVAKFDFAGLREKYSKLLLRKENEIFAELAGQINLNGPEAIYHLYLDALNLLSTLTQHLQHSVVRNITSAVKEMKIWQRPWANLDDDDLVLYKLTLGEVKSHWKLPLSSFAKKAPQLLKVLLSGLFDDLAVELDWVKREYVRYFEEAENYFQRLNNTLQELLQNSVINEDFIVQNFLRLDVFYDELTHEIVEQTPAYDLTQVFSDMGGYLGLLLGASAITIFEFLDLIFHYAFLRCFGSPNKSEQYGTKV